MSQFTDPAAPGSGGDDFNCKDYLGTLVAIDVLATKDQVATKFGPADAISANVTVIDGPAQGTVLHDCLIFGQVVYSQLKGSVGSKILGRIAQGVAQAGKSAPWQIATATDEEKAYAGQVLAAVQAQGLSSPVPTPDAVAAAAFPGSTQPAVAQVAPPTALVPGVAPATPGVLV